MLTIRQPQIEVLADASGDGTLIETPPVQPESGPQSPGLAKLVIRDDQAAGLAQARLVVFEDSMCQHVRKFFPNHHRVAGEAAIRQVVRYGSSKAKEHSFTTERNACLYITVMLMLGSDFDQDPLYPWAAGILGDEAYPDPSSRASALADEALTFQTKVAGKDNRDLNRAFLTLRKHPSRLIADAPPGEGFASYMMGLLRGVYPRRYEALGEAIIDRLIADGVAGAQRYGVTAGNGKSLVISMMFIMGSAFDRDPLFPWTRSILTDRSIKDETARVNRLYEAAVAFLEKWLEKPPETVRET